MLSTKSSTSPPLSSRLVPPCRIRMNSDSYNVPLHNSRKARGTQGAGQKARVRSRALAGRGKARASVPGTDELRHPLPAVAATQAERLFPSNIRSGPFAELRFELAPPTSDSGLSDTSRASQSLETEGCGSHGSKESPATLGASVDDHSDTAGAPSKHQCDSEEEDESSPTRRRLN